jgi:hypothetical protein
MVIALAYNPTMPLRMFISHAHEDKALAAALQRLIFDVFLPGDTQTVKVDYSSDDAPGQGPAAGAEWLEWILETVRVADICVVILSENSVGTPWVTWEAGAVTGAALSTVSASTHGGSGRVVVPLLFGISVDRIPAPLQHRRAVNGTEPTEVARLLYRLHGLSGSSAHFDDTAAKARVEAFVEEVRHTVQASVLARSPRLRLPDSAAIHFINCQSSLVMEPMEGAIANGVRVCCGKLTGDAHQQWRFLPVRKGTYRITMADQSKCLSVQNDSVKPRAPIILWDYEAIESQHWRLLCDPGAANTLSTVRIVNCASNLCLMPKPGSGHLMQTQLANLLNQDWWVLVTPLVDFE